MKKTLWNGISRTLRHGMAPFMAYAVGQGWITEDQGMNLTNAVLVIASTGFAIFWSVMRAKFPMIAWL